MTEVRSAYGSEGSLAVAWGLTIAVFSDELFVEPSGGDETASRV